MIPEILNSKDGGVGVLNRLGVDKSFMNDMYKKYGSYASKIGLNSDTVRNTLSAIEKNIGDKPASKQMQKKSNGFDSSRYPKL